MIEWLIQSTAGHPALARGIAPAGLLSEPEQQRLIELKTIKRRSDWLIGRWTAKHLIQAYVERQTGVQSPLHTLVVINDPDGAPRPILDFGFPISDYNPELKSKIQNLKLSISHCHGHAFCAISDLCGAHIGVDIERVEPRAEAFAEDYFTARELEQLHAAPPERRDLLTTLIWSAKESILKTLRLGLSVDTRKVECAVGLLPPVAAAWKALGVSAAPELLGESEYVFHAWWRQYDAYVLTMVVMGNECHYASSISREEIQNLAFLH